MPDMNMLAPAVIVFFSFTIVGMLIHHASGRKTAQRQKEAWLQHGTIPEHGLIDDSASLGATLACIGLAFIGGYIAIALLFFQSNLLWALILFHSSKG